MFRFNAIKAQTVSEIKAGVRQMLLETYADLLPASMDARILLKPNLNANMNALTGNTTDLRLLAAVIEALKERGYSDITIGEGTNSGYYRNRISVIARLRIDALARHYGVKVLDFNYAEPADVEFEGGTKAQVASLCKEAELFINMPKLKTHFEAGMSVTMKNLMGCLIGQENKKKTHQALSANIVNLNLALKPHLHIVDALISMEGLGPTRGTPINTGNIFFGTDPYLIDLLSAKFAGFDPEKVRPLKEAAKRGLVTDAHKSFVGGYNFDRTFNFKPPVAGPIATFIHSPKRQKYFLAVRNTALFNALCSTKLGGKILYATGLRQDVFIDEEMEMRGLRINKSKCTDCGRCAEYCPTGVPVPKETNPGSHKDCLGCLYCYCVCPERAVEFDGNLGFMAEQLRQYDDIVRAVCSK